MFKNARLFRLEDALGLDAMALEQQLTNRRFQPCGPLTLSTMGWSEPLGGETQALVHEAAGCLLICAKRQERLLPASVVAEVLEERVSDIETAEGRTVGRAERRQLKEAVTAELLPQSFTRSRRILAYVDTVAHWVVVDAASERMAEDLVSLLRETLGTLPASLLRPSVPPPTLMTRWVSEGRGEQGFELGDACELRDPKDKQSVVRCRGQDLAGDEIATHLQAGKQVTQLALEWEQRLSLVLAEDLSLKRLRLTDELIEDSGVLEADDPAARFDAEFTLLIHEMRGLLERLDGLFGLSSSEAAEVPW
ncbi:recombination-associated protein RdgC [Ectothiorhodospira lacustris]|uniref:recombination-associated protein RdgC n=1 Tax=Ectothiorhodospira lacustris TaxID=2899127 RepID=UPI001EE7D002|nr:recombination-associated protein RdgC [Ectothiorhodospira lacustris]MCG5499848.1 recombination-associated protein RdgC [Ectothiorhodospira lacustris]MCG5508996.1 recombination-associated protein RdgC [Ectothiorhodospira lacustris]MCG5520787.1 recombination-associated protein RdgC [Ectothiorhodospira lacustris]